MLINIDMKGTNYYSIMKISTLLGELQVPKSRWLRNCGLMETWFIVFHDLRTPADDIIIVRFS